MRGPSWSRRGVLGLLAVVAAASIVSPATGDEPLAGVAGTDTSLPATDSQVTVTGRGKFAGLTVTVNQTRNLVNQAISVTWTGGVPTTTGATRFDGNYLQIMQCWGEDDGTHPENPGPPPEQCVQGATDAVYGGRLSGIFSSGNNTLTRVISRRDLSTFDPDDGYLDEETGLVWRPFRAVDGTEIDVHHDPDFNPSLQGGNYWLNPYFNIITTNEISGGRTSPDGTGQELFEINTGIESTGLGCGQKVQPVPGGAPTTPRCWLVVVPRGEPVDENAGLVPNPGANPVFTSPLSTRAWQNRIAVPLEFNPVDSSCSLTDEQRRIAGNEHVLVAVSSWQRQLCTDPNLVPYAYGTISDANARRQLQSGALGTAGMVVVSRPYDPTTLDPADPVVYAPLSASATVIGFNIERNPKPDGNLAEDALRGIRVAEINLTPRLVAKLLTQSYRYSVAIKSVAPPYEWVTKNPAHLAVDRDFLQFNPEFQLLNIAGGKNVAGLVLPALSSDAARAVWEWILADPEAKAWLDGAPDPWGMQVNPVYATSADQNSTGAAFADPVPESFPKSDPYCFQGPPQGPGGNIVPPALCGTDWIPYLQTLRDTARVTRAAADGAKTVDDPNAEVAELVYKADGPQILGSRAIMALTDSPSAYQYGLQTARLSRAGDDGPTRTFVAADLAGITAGLASMAPQADPAFLEPAPTTAADGAYPLTVLTYGAIRPLTQDAKARAEYAAFVEYAAGPGQVPGRDLGQLPPGYVPLSADLRAQAVAAATTIRELQPRAEPASAIESAPTGSGGTPTADPAEAAAPAVPLPPSVPRRASGATPPAFPDGSSSAEALTPAAEVPEPAVPLVLTPIVAVARSRFVLPVLAGMALLSALGALEITKKPRRVPAAPPGGGS